MTIKKYSKAGMPFILPDIATGPEVILPMSQIQWLLAQPDHILNQNEINRLFLHADRTMLHPSIIQTAVHGRVIRKEMTKDLDALTDAIVHETRTALENIWGTDNKNWREVAVYDTMLEVIGRMSNRALVGFPLCQDADYLRSSSTFAKNVVITATLINLLPSILRPIFGPIITAYDMFHFRKLRNIILPIIKERSWEFFSDKDYPKRDYSEHNDYVQWALHDAFSHENPNERALDLITKRLVVLSFAAIHSSVITITNAIFDIAASSLSVNFQQGLREEVQQLTSDGRTAAWQSTNLTKMIRIDSALRESMRLWGFISRGVMKMVIAPEGVTIPTGEHLPYGAKVGVTSYAVHHDPSVYPDPYTYNAFRFSQPLEGPGFSEELDTFVKRQSQTAMVTSSNIFMGFSHGRHLW